MRFRKLLCIALVTIGSTASAETNPNNPNPQTTDVESVSVIGTRDKQRIKEFIDSFAAPTALHGKLSRWRTGICPIAVGLRPAAIKFILDRIKSVASHVGAPVNAHLKCDPNIEIVFTLTPQGLLDNTRKNHLDFLGYSSNSGQTDKLAIVVRPIQAWYTTQSTDLNGFSKVDSARTVGLGDSAEFQFSLMGNTTGLHIRDAWKSELYHVIIVIDPNKLGDHEIGGIADYISFLALSQLASLDRCQQLPSIMDMVIPGCPAISEMTSNDFAFLRGLYKMPLDGNLLMQKNAILYEMAKSLQRE